MAHPSGAGSRDDLRLDFDRRVRLEFRGSQLSSDGGLLIVRELDDALGLSDLASVALADPRTGANRVHLMAGLFRQSVYGRLAGYENVNNAERLAHDPVMRQVVGHRAVDSQAASTSQMSRFETEGLATKKNRAALADLSGRWIDRFLDRAGQKYIVLDMDSSVSPTHGEQEGTAWNGHFGCSCYNPLFLFNQFGMLERCALRSGNVHSADGWKGVLEPVILRYADRDMQKFFRADAAFALPDLYKTLEAAGYFYAIRLPANAVLQERIAHRLKRPVGRPPKYVRRFYEDFEYQAKSWDRPRRVISKIEWHPGELFPRVGFVVTNLPMAPEDVIGFYNRRGTAAQHIREGKYAIRWTRLSCRRFRDNEVRLQLHALAYNLAVFLANVGLPEPMADWSLTSFQLKVIKIGARVVRHARAITFQLAEVAVSGPMVSVVIVACSRFRGHADKIVTMDLESGHDETEVQPRVQDRGGEAGDGARRNRRSGLDTHLARTLLDLPFISSGETSLATRNLIRGQSFLLPSGESFALAIGRPETEIDQVRSAVEAATGGALAAGTPLWLYFLMEAEVIGREAANGSFEPAEGLGPAGAKLVAETIVGLLELDERSWLGTDRAWSPDRSVSDPERLDGWQHARLGTAMKCAVADQGGASWRPDRYRKPRTLPYWCLRTKTEQMQFADTASRAGCSQNVVLASVS